MGTVKIVVLSALLVPGAAAAAGVTGLSGTYTGKTSQSRPVVIRLAQGSVAAPSRLSWSMACGNLALSGTSRFAGGLGAGGSFSPPAVKTVLKRGGTRLDVTTTVRFSLSRRVARGTFRSAATAYSRSGTRLRRCASPKITFTAHRR